MYGGFMVGDKKEKKDGGGSGYSGYAIGFALGILAGRHGIPSLTHGLYITLITLTVVYNWGGC